MALNKSTAISYAQKRAAQHKAHGGKMSFRDCETCMAKGGAMEKGVHINLGMDPDEGRSMAGIHVRSDKDKGEKDHFKAKFLHQGVLAEIKKMKGRNRENLADGGDVGNCKGALCPGCRECMAGGGEALHHSPAGGSANRSKGAARSRTETNQEGVHKSRSVYSPGESSMGYSVRAGDPEGAKKVAYDKIREQRNVAHRNGRENLAQGGEVPGYMSTDDIKAKPGGEYIENPTEAQARSGYRMNKAEGGEIDADGDHDGDDALMDGVADELLHALESKNKKEIMECFRAIVLSCLE